MNTRYRPSLIQIILSDGDADLHVTDASVLRLARLIGRQMAREKHERQRRHGHRGRRTLKLARKS